MGISTLEFSVSLESSRFVLAHSSFLSLGVSVLLFGTEVWKDPSVLLITASSFAIVTALLDLIALGF